MTTRKMLLDKFSIKLVTKEQQSAFEKCLVLLDKHLAYSERKRYGKKDSKVIFISDIDNDNFEEKYGYWLCDNWSGLFFTNVHAKHEDLRRCLFIMKQIVEGKTVNSDIIDNYKIDLEGYYTALNQGFYKSGGVLLGSRGSKRPKVVCALDWDFDYIRFPFLKDYDPNPIFFDKDSALKEIEENIK
ncbi:MAG: hypothetical protein CL760_05815 [Chloroflexi bacterium]|nr:hypothetical protein [Chloroflexota bacterium]|tara:strand:+ start:2546 stop:3103 length:558 start_codon:yes stop_codon:yes gene_type:complete